MARIYLVRHGRAAAGFNEDRDPGLDTTGQAQAEAVARQLVQFAPIDLVTSPLRRTRETAAPLERLISQHARIADAVAEVPSPSADLAARGEWLRTAMQGGWSDLAPRYQQWRRDVVAYLCALSRDTIVFSHFIAINAAIGHATGDDRLRCHSPDNCSVTIFDIVGGELQLVERGVEGQTRIN